MGGGSGSPPLSLSARSCVVVLGSVLFPLSLLRARWHGRGPGGGGLPLARAVMDRSAWGDLPFGRGVSGRVRRWTAGLAPSTRGDVGPKPGARARGPEPGPGPGARGWGPRAKNISNPLTGVQISQFAKFPNFEIGELGKRGNLGDLEILEGPGSTGSGWPGGLPGQKWTKPGGIESPSMSHTSRI